VVSVVVGGGWVHGFVGVGAALVFLAIGSWICVEGLSFVKSHLHRHRPRVVILSEAALMCPEQSSNIALSHLSHYQQQDRLISVTHNS